MVFCPKCKNIMVPSSDGEEFFCECGYRDKENVLIRENISKQVKKIEILEDISRKVLPVTQKECLKCKHNEAYFWSLQTLPSDEAETQFFECVKCRYRWRQYR